MNCWVCGRAIEGGQQVVPARNVPRRFHHRLGQLVHLRCHGDWEQAATFASRATARPPTPAPHRTRTMLFAEDIATLRGISRRQAHRWLAQLEEIHGTTMIGRVSGRRGPRRYITPAALERIGPSIESEGDRLAEMVTSILDRLSALERAIFGGATALA